MFIRHTTIALAAVAALASSAQAVTIADMKADQANVKVVRITGASALRLALGGYLQELAQPNTLHVFYNDAGGASHRAYSFKLNKAIGSWPVGTTVLVTKRDAGGSGQGVVPLIAADATQTHMDVFGTCTKTALGDTPTGDIQAPNYYCAGTVAGLAHAGLSDVEPAMLTLGVNGGSGQNSSVLNAAGFVQNIFGVAVSVPLYRALQNAQGLTQDDAEANMPSLPIPFVRGVLAGSVLGNTSAKKGWNIVVPGAFTQTVNVCRRTNGSGTQAASHAFFSDNPCSGDALAISAGSANAKPAVTGIPLVVKTNSGSGDVVQCLGNGKAGDANQPGATKIGAYALGVLGRENNPLPVVNGVQQDLGFRFVKLNNTAPNRANTVNGSYEFVVESTMQWANPGQANAPAADVLSFLQDLRTNIGKASVLQKLDVDFQQGLAASPSTITGNWEDLSAMDKGYVSRYSRAVAKSCSVVRYSK